MHFIRANTIKMSRILFIGGPGNISENTVRYMLLNEENKLGLLTLPGTSDKGLSSKVDFFYGDRNQPAFIEKTMTAFRPDIVVDFVCFQPEQAKAISEILTGRVQQFIFVSTCDVYGYPLSQLPMPENGKWVTTNSTYAENKRKCEIVFNEYSEKGAFPLTVVRPSYSLGNEFVISFFSRDGGKYLIPHLRAGKPIFVPGDGNTLMHASVAINTGRMIGNIIGKAHTFGKSYTCGHDHFITHDKYVRLFADALGVVPNLVHIPYDLLQMTGNKNVSESILEDVTRHNIAFSLESFKNDFPDFKWEVSLEEAARNFIKYNDERDLFPSIEEEIFEDRIIRVWEIASKEFILNLKDSSEFI